MSNYKLLSEETPNHKDLVLCWNGIITMPAIYYDNHSFKGFYFFTTYYHTDKLTVYSEVKLKQEHEIKGVIKWKLID